MVVPSDQHVLAAGHAPIASESARFGLDDVAQYQFAPTATAPPDHRRRRDELTLTHSAGGRAADRLVRDGYATRMENPEDRRQKLKYPGSKKIGKALRSERPTSRDHLNRSGR